MIVHFLLLVRRTARREPFIKPIEPARKKHMASNDIGVSNVPNGVNLSNDFTSCPSSTCSESNGVSISSTAGSESNISLLRDTGHDRLTDDKTDTTMKSKEDLDSEVSVELTPSLVHKGSGDRDLIDSELCSFGLKGREKEISNQPSHVQEDAIGVSKIDGYHFSPATPSSVEALQTDLKEPNGCNGEFSRQPSHLLEDVSAVAQTDSNFLAPATLTSAETQCMKCEKPLGISDANYHIKDSGSIWVNGEVPHLSGYLADGNISHQSLATNTVHNMDVMSSHASVSSSPSIESKNSVVSKSELVMAEHHPSGSANGVGQLRNVPCRSEGNKALLLVSENGSFGKPKPLFSRGFLDKPTGKKSAEHEKRTQGETPKSAAAAAKIANGYANGQSKINIDANGPTLVLTSERGKISSDPGVALDHRGSLNGFYRKSAAELKIGQAKCRVPGEVASGSEAASSNENCSPSNNVTVCNKENGCRVYDTTSRLDEDENDDDRSGCPPKLVDGTCYQAKHVSLCGV